VIAILDEIFDFVCSVGHVSLFRGEQPVNIQQSSEAEDDQLIQVCELEIENISSTVFIL
jgi:hypothetical protein